MLGKTLWMSLAFAAALGLSIGCSNKDEKKDGAKDGAKDGKGGDKGGAPATASTPEDAVKGMFEAMKAGNIDTALGYFPKAHADAFRKMLKDMEDAAAAQKEFGDALKAKFNKDGPPSAFPNIREDMKKEGESVVSYSITKKEEKSADKIAITIKTVKKKDGMEKSDEKTGWAIKEADGWKLLPPDMPDDPKAFEAQTGPLGKMTAAYKKLAKEINDGTIKSFDDAQQALGKALIGG